MQLAGHDVHLGLVEVELGLLRRVEIGQIGKPEALDEALGQDVDLGQVFDDRGERAAVRRGVPVVERPERLGERAEADQVLTLRLVIHVKLRDLQRAEIGIDHAQSHGARLAHHIGQAIGAGRRSADGRDLGDAESQVCLRHDYFETGDRHVQVEEVAQPGRPNAGQALQLVIDEDGIFPGVVDERRFPGGRHLRDAVAARARLGSGIGSGIGYGKGQIAQLEPAAEVGQGQGQGQDLDAHGLALRRGPDLGEAEGLVRIGGNAALQRLGQVLAQGIGIERPRRRNRSDPKAQPKDGGLRWGGLAPIWDSGVLEAAPGKSWRQGQALLGHHPAQAVRIVGDDAVDAQIDERGHVGRLVDGPDHHAQAEVVRRAQLGCAQAPVIGRPDRATGRLDRARRRAVEAVHVETGGPGRDAGPAALQVIQPAFLGAQVDGRDLGGEFLERRERAPIEGLHHGAAGHARIPERRHQRLGEGLGRDRLLGRQRRGLDLQVVAHARARARLGQREDLGERRDGDPVAALLLGEALGRPAAGAQAADVVGAELGARQLEDRRGRRLQPGAVGPARALRIEPAVVVDHQDPVAGHGQVHLQGGHAERQRRREAGQAVLGMVAARAAVALQVEGGERGPHVRGRCGRNQKGNQPNRRQHAGDRQPGARAPRRPLAFGGLARRLTGHTKGH